MADGSEQVQIASGAELAERARMPLDANGPVRLSLQVADDTSGRGITLRSAQIEAPGAAATTPVAVGAMPPTDRPNILVYLVDTLRADHLGAYGYSRPTSPALDRMAQDGVVFERMIAQSGWTRTSVASVMTGLNPLVHGVLGRDDALPAEAITLPVLMTDLGYETVAVITNGNVSGTFGFDVGFDSFRYLNEQPQDRNREVHRLSDDVNTEFLGWLDARTSDEPFFAYLHTSDPHAPYLPREPQLGQFVGDMRRTGLEWPRYARGFVAGQDEFSPEDVRDEMVALYDAEIAFNDLHFGNLLAALEARGIADDTVIVFTSDHGEEFLDHGAYGHGKTLYRELVQVPLVMRLPGNMAAGTRPAAMAQHIDLLPTLLELAGGVVPAWAQGRSLAPAFADPEWFSNEVARSYLQLDVSSVASLVAGDWHLLRSPMVSQHARTLGIEMFNLAQDPAELLNRRAEMSVRAGLLLTAWRRAEAGDTPLFAIDSAEIDPELAARLRDLGYIR
jgi:arylsulfatase A-like enzyme